MFYVFLDRDGTLIRHIPYLDDPERVELLPSVRPGLEELTRAGCKLFLHTNQSGIGRGYFSLAQAEACNAAMVSRIDLGANLFTDIRICPESPDEPVVYRKPSPRYALEIMQRFRIGPDRLCYIGDNISDLLTAKNVGCPGIGVSTGVKDLRATLQSECLTQFPVFDSFVEAVRYLLASRQDQRIEAH